MEKLLCINKIRDARGNITSYVLKKENGAEFKATGKQIKAEIAAKKYDFVNLQIDRAGRLVDKAVPKQPVKSKQKSVADQDDFYTIEDLIRGVDPKGRKVRCYNRNIGKYVVGEGVELYTPNKEIGNTILVYIEELNSNMKTGLIPLKDFDRFWAKYKEEFPYINKNMQDLNYYGKCTKPDEETFQRILEFCKQSVDEFDLKFGFGKAGNKVDAKPNPEGRFTISAIGKTPDKDIYKIKDKEQKKEYWEMYRGINPNVNDNQYTNVGIHRNENVLSDSIPVIDCTDLVKRHEACKEKIKKEIRSQLEDGIEYTSDKQLFVKDKEAFDKVCNKVKKLWETLEVNESFEDMLIDCFENIIEFEKHSKRLYFGYLEYEGSWMDNNTMFSYNQEIVERYLDSYVDDYMYMLESHGRDTFDAMVEALSWVCTNVTNPKYNKIKEDE